MPTLRDLGLSEYEASVYRALLSTGPTTAKTLSRASDVPMGRIYDVLNDLEAAGMVRSQSASRPQKYAPVEPETALERRLEEKESELEAERRRYEATVGELVERLDAGETDEQFWTVAVGPEDTADLLEERLGAAADRIVMVADAPSTQFDPAEIGERFAAAIEAALDRGVEVSALVSPGLLGALPDAVRRRYRSTVREHPEFELRVAEDIVGTFHLIDRVEVCIEVANPLAPDETFALIDLTDPSFAADVHEEFAPRWERADTPPAP